MIKKLKFFVVAIMAIFMFFSCSDDDELSPSKGDGTADSPYLIKNYSDLKALADSVNAGKTYEGISLQLANDIDLSYEATDDFESSSLQIGLSEEISVSYENIYYDSIFYTNCFMGTFDGNNHTISGLNLNNRTSDDSYYKKNESAHTGLFPNLQDATIKNLNVNCNNVGFNMVGGIVGACKNSEIVNCNVEGHISASLDGGGIVGHSEDSKIINCKFNGSIILEKLNHETYSVNWPYGLNAGGIAGRTENSSINDCKTSGQINNGDSDLGGICGGASHSEVLNCESTMDITGSWSIGGICGRFNDEFSEMSRYSEQGIVGCLYTGKLTGEAHIGGISGVINCTSLSDCESNVEITYRNTNLNRETYNFGGLIGMSDNTELFNSISNGTIIGTDNCGGLIGAAKSASVENCHAYVDVQGNQYIGGIVGQVGATNNVHPSSFTKCSSTSTIIGQYYTGGFSGGISSIHPIAKYQQCFTNTTVQGGEYTGGFTAYACDTIIDCYAHGDVSGGANTGGFAGKSSSGSIHYIKNCYSVGESGNNGFTDSEINLFSCYWEQNSSGSQSSTLIRTQAQMKTQSTYTGWDFNNIWEMGNSGYPELRGI
ncbi:MAG: hypothetical protein GQ564_16580 [Bacteroidales bacterium]|nr:hypothetical protein [Bacteroidales bacterium]